LAALVRQNGAIGFIVIVVIILVIRSKEKRERIKSVDAASFNSFADGKWIYKIPYVSKLSTAICISNFAWLNGYTNFIIIHKMVSF